MLCPFINGRLRDISRSRTNCSTTSFAVESSSCDGTIPAFRLSGERFHPVVSASIQNDEVAGEEATANTKCPTISALKSPQALGRVLRSTCEPSLFQIASGSCPITWSDFRAKTDAGPRERQTD